MEKKTKIYCGSGKKRADNWLTVTINPDKFKDHIQEYNGSKFVKLNINVLASPDKFGKDVQISIDTYEPKEKSNFTHDNTPPNDLPF